MAMTQIANSVVTDQVSPLTAFSVTSGTFLLACTAGEIALEVQLPSAAWVKVAELDEGGITRLARVTAGQALVVTNFATGLSYRLITPNGKATGAAYELT